MNTYFNNYYAANEQELIQNLNKESISIMGMEVLYLERKYQKLDKIFNEDILSSFERATPIDVQLLNLDGWGGNSDFLTKFGMQTYDMAEWAVSSKAFREATGLPKPYDGDLLYYPIPGTLWEIRFVEDEQAFYPLGTLPTYIMKTQLFDYSYENLNTGIPEIDDKEMVLDEDNPENETIVVEGKTIADEFGANDNFDEEINGILERPNNGC